MNVRSRHLGTAVLALIITATLAASPASAVSTSSWTESVTHYTTYVDGGYVRSAFAMPPSSVPATAKITKTSWAVAPYTNGYTADTVTLCYQQVYTSTDYRCLDIAVTNGTTMSTTLFNGLSPKGIFMIKHTLFGGTYPATGGTAQDTVRVDYQY